MTERGGPVDRNARRVFWGFFFLLLDFNLNLGSAFTIPLVPNFVGWIFLWRGADALSSARPSLGLLKPFCGALGVCALTQFVPSPGWPRRPGWLSLLLVRHSALYTDFQLLTDLAALARRRWGTAAELAKRLRTARTLFVAEPRRRMYCYDLVVSGSRAWRWCCWRSPSASQVLSAVPAVGAVPGPGDTAEPVGRELPPKPSPGG